MTPRDSQPAQTGLKELDNVAWKWHVRTKVVEKAHFTRCVRFRKSHVALGCVTIVCTSLLGVLANFHFNDNKISWMNANLSAGIEVSITVLTVIAPVLTGLVSFLRFDEKSTLHHNAAARFASMKRRLQVMMSECSSGCDRNQVIRELKNICEKWDALTLQAPALYKQEWNMAEEEEKQHQEDLRAQSTTNKEAQSSDPTVTGPKARLESVAPAVARAG
jgi:hypothetical protein